jgi:hypothetical protein
MGHSRRHIVGRRALPIRWLTAFLDFPASTFESGRAFWQGVTATTLSPSRGELGEFATLVPDRGDAYLRVQRLDRGPGRCHLDLHTDDVGASSKLAVEHGAVVLRNEDDITVLRSPGGLTFCFVEHHGETERPPPRLWSDGHRSRVDQLCIDIPGSAFEDETAFWAVVTGWERRFGSRPEFDYLTRPAGMPLRLLLQRVAHEQSGFCHAHLDLACDDVGAERLRHEALGATTIRIMPDWTTLEDPAGLHYCVTRRSPDTGML